MKVIIELNDYASIETSENENLVNLIVKSPERLDGNHYINEALVNIDDLNLALRKMTAK